ncbi:hypothetical protein [Chromohalobacter japonicus]|uniref:hypothetical protein n=1 Tax=Chromohalobacter japonicus TaxID=223900 RepID=UPI0005912FC8|nr:hypothetical protein [Chromohalobacter japonicus]
MNHTEYQRVVEELNTLITDTRQLIARFEDTGMDNEMPDDYTRLELMVSEALKQQRHYMQKVLETDSHD